MAESRPTRRSLREDGPVPISVVYTTARAEPRIDWLVEGLVAQARPGDDLELVVVDLRGRQASELEVAPFGPVTRVVVSPPKPTPWQGPQRVASRDHWAAASARNTGIVLCSRGYVVFLDDRCQIKSRWLAAVRDAARLSLVVAGTYDRVDEGRLVADHRRSLVPRGRVRCRGGLLYGANFAAPLERLLEVNGLEEGCDGGTSEDVVLGKQLANRGNEVWLSSDMDLVKVRPPGTHHGMTACPERRTRAAVARFGQLSRTQLTPDLRALRLALAETGRFPDVDPETRDWWTQRRIADAY